MSDPNFEQELEKARQEMDEAKLQERKAKTQLDKFHSITPLAPTEDVESSDGDAWTKASERKRAATEQRQKKEDTYNQLLQRRDELGC